MKHRAIKDLAQLKEEELYNAVSEGLFLCFENANELWENAESLFESRKFRGSRVLAAFACEEASKCLILLDS